MISAFVSPFANNAPTRPVEPPTVWTLLAFARREFEQTVFNQSPTVSPPAGAITNGLLTDTPTLNSQSIDPILTRNIGTPTPGLSDLTPIAQPSTTAQPATFTGEPSIANQITVSVFRGLRAFTDFTALFGVDTATPIAQLLTSVDPPWFTTLGLNVQRSEFEGMPVWTLQPADPSGKYVVGVHGGGFTLQPSIFNWIDYAVMASNTRATVIVPIYPLAPQGTAGAVVPVMADLISSQIDQHVAENVSVYGDSAGGDIALAAVQELVRRGDPVPSHMVLVSPALDLTLSNPAMQFIDDPILSPQVLRQAQQWAGDLDLNDPLVSPLYGSLAGLPPTAVYFGSLDVLSPDGLVLQDKALTTPGADFTFILQKGLIHDWAIVPWLPEAIAIQPEMYRQLGLTLGPSLNVNSAASPIPSGLVTDTPTLTSPSVDPVTTATAVRATFTGEPSLVSQAFTAVLTAVFQVLRVVENSLGVDLGIPLGQLISSDSPPWFTTLGLNVHRGEFEGMPAWTLQPANPSGKYVVAVHGGAFVLQPEIWHWLANAAMASDTRATVIVPIYPLAPQGTAGTVVPVIADLVSSQIDQHVAENVSVYGDSAGGDIALAAVQELVRRGDPVPSHMVLISPALDGTLNNPAIQFVDDPVFSDILPTLHKYNQLWAGDLDLTDPLISPLFGSLAGLPPTAVYAGSREIIAPDVLVLQDKALATPGADFTFILRKGEIDHWALTSILPEAQAVLPDIYQQLGIIGSEALMDPA